MERFSKLGAPFQYGCLKGKGVSETHLPLRLHLHIGARLRLATAVIFVDIKSAYYTVVKEFFFETQPEDGLAAIKGLFHRLHLPEAALDDFVTTVMETDLLDAADVPLVLRQLIQSTITASWFQIPGSDKVCVPATGTRPGDPLADVLFAYVMSSVLWDAYQTFFEEGLLAPWIDHPPGTTWADDTCILLAGECEKIDAMAATAYSVLHARNHDALRNDPDLRAEQDRSDDQLQRESSSGLPSAPFQTRKPRSRMSTGTHRELQAGRCLCLQTSRFHC